MPQEDTDKREQAQETLAEAMAAAFDEEFEEFAASEFARRAVRGSIEGKVKRRTLMRLGFAQGCKTGNTGAGYVHRAQLVLALGLQWDADELPEWPDLMDAVRDLVKRDGEASS